MRICDAHDLSRFMPDTFRDVVEFEEPISYEIREALCALGHNIRPANKPIGGSRAVFINRDINLLFGGFDPHKDGHAISY